MDSDPDAAEDEAFPPLPPPQSPGRGGHDEGDPFANGEEDGEVSKLADVPAAKRKGVRRPQPKLDSQRLISDRGLPALRTLFETVHFRGKGHEADDLRRLMQRMENWAHRLYPKLQFDDFIERVEKLGNKKEVQTCLKRIRLDMPLTHEDYAGDEEAAPEPHASEDPDPFGDASFPGGLWAAAHSTPAPTPAAPSPPAPSLTEEQRQRMELNRRRALERKLARRQQQPTGQDQDQDQGQGQGQGQGQDQNQDQNQDQGEGAEDFDPEPASSSDPPAGSPPRRDEGEEAGEEDGDGVPNKSSCL